jgi:hypothetical protein
MPKDYKSKKKRKFSGNRYDTVSTKKARVDNVNSTKYITDSEASTSNDGLNKCASARKIDIHNILCGSKEKLLIYGVFV